VLPVASANIQQLNEYFEAVLAITSKTPIQAPISSLSELLLDTLFCRDPAYQ
jgi:hypothetical protein